MTRDCWNLACGNRATSLGEGHDPRRGVVLLQVSFMMLVLMGLVGLVVDLGIARTTQGSMQLGVDVAALEGMRLRDNFPGDPDLSDLDRRLAASRVASLVYDEDLDLSTGAAAYLLGAGPQMSTGVAGIHDPAGGLLQSRGPYLPQLETNAAGNEVHGDLVAGTYIARDPSPVVGNPNWHAEDGTYRRADFAVASAAAAPGAPALLARMRRTHDPRGLDEVEGVSSRGPSIPFLFALGSGTLSTPDPAAYDPRRDGITVRANAIAQARPVVAAGRMGPTVNGLAVLGVGPALPAVTRVLTLEDASWTTQVPIGGTLEVVVRGDGTLQGTAAGPTPGLSGFAWSVPGLLRVGDVSATAPSAGALVIPASDPGIEGIRYLGLYGTDAGGISRILAFAAIDIERAEVIVIDPTGEPALRILGRKLDSLVAPENASAQPSLATDLGALAPDLANRAPLLAPTLAR